MGKLELAELGLRSILRNAIVVIGLIFSRMQPDLFAMGLMLFLLGAGLHFWSKGVLVRNWMVTTAGPYRAVRHPFYLANFLIDMGICFVSGNIYLIVAYLPLFMLAYLPVIHAEERFLRETHGEAYDRYAAQVPMLIPWYVHRFLGDPGFTWDNIIREKEGARLLRLLAIPLYFPIVHCIFRSDAWLPWRILIVLFCAALAIALNASSLIARRLARREFWNVFP